MIFASWPCNFELSLISKGGMLPPGNKTTTPWNWKLGLPPGHFGLLMTLSQQAKKEFTVLVGRMDPNNQ